MKEQLKLTGLLGRILRWPLYLSILLIVMNIPIYWVNIRAGIYASIFTAVYIIIALILYLARRRSLFRELIGFAHEYDDVQKTMLSGLKLPYALLDGEGKVIWMNQAFATIIGKDLKFRKSLGNIFKEFTKDELPQGEDQVDLPVEYQQKFYSLTMHRIPINSLANASTLLQNQPDYNYLIAAYLFDETELTEVRKKYEDVRPVLGLLYLDNFEESTEKLEEVRTSLLLALIERRITQYFASIDALVRKTEKDRYLLIMTNGSYRQLEEQHFDILEEVKEVKLDNDIAVTLSIGVGMNGSNFLENYEEARIAIEMALGRGGDQAIVKDGDQISYFGGKSPQMEKSTRVTARVKAQALKEFIATQERIVVMGHKITDVDAFGAAIGIYRAAKSMDRTVHIVINDPTTSIKPLMSGFLDNPEYEKDMFVTSQEAKGLVDEQTVVVVVDTNKPSYTECEELLHLTHTIVVLDHHRRGAEIIDNAVLSYVEPFASSSCEMIAEILQYFSDDIHINNLEADSIYAGIMIDTNNFTTKTGVRTFEAAAFLRRCGADVTRVRKMLRDDMCAYKARSEAISHAEQFLESYAITVCPSEGLESPTVVAAQTSNEMLNISGVKASFVLTDYNHVIYISARSIDEVNVSIIMEKLGGGGHLNIAGAQLENKTVEEAVQILKDTIAEMQNKGEI